MLTQVQTSASYVYRVFSTFISGAMCGRAVPVEELQLMHELEDIPAFDSIKFLSYNIFIRPPAPKFTHNVTDDYKDQRLQSFIDNYLDNYDVVCLQEMFGAFSGRRRKLIREARKRGFIWKVSSPQSRSSMYLVDGGCLILSKVKIVAESATIFPPGMMSDRLAAKGAIYAKLCPKPGVFVHLFVTHLQAIYPGSSTVQQCMKIQESQYDELTNFVLTTVAEHESTEDMLLAMAQTPPMQQTIDSARQSRRWPILIAGDFNCNSRPVPGDIVSKTTQPYQALTDSLSQIGPFSDLLFQAIGEHPVTYASANFSLNGTFSPHETALTHPDDYHESAEFVNQSLDYIFLVPGVPSNICVPLEAGVKHLPYVSSAPSDLKFLSDHWALESIFQVEKQL